MSGVALGDLVRPDGVLFDLPASNKSAMLVAMASHAAAAGGVDAGGAIEVIRGREALGSTGFGGGTAIPHGRVPGLTRIVVVAARLANGIDFAALDGLPVDLAVLMLAPAGAGADHLKALAQVSRAFRDTALCGRLRGATTADAFYTLLAGERRAAA